MSNHRRNNAKDRNARQRFNALAKRAEHWQSEAENSRAAFQEYREQTSAIIQALKEQSNTDSLTGLASRRAFDQGLRRMIEMVIRHPDLDEPLSVVYCDLDGFKAINDNLSHDDGDKALQDMAKRLRIFIHPREIDLLARPGGDEFTYAAIGDPRAIKEHFYDVREHLKERKSAQSMTCPNGDCYDVHPYHRHGLSFGIATFNKAFILKKYDCDSFSDLNAKLNKKEISIDRIAQDLAKEADIEMYKMKRLKDNPYQHETKFPTPPEPMA